MSDGLSKEEALDEQLLEYLASAWSHELAARACGVSAKTVQRRLRNAEFSRELGRRRALAVEETHARFQLARHRAVDVIVEMFESTNPNVRLRAADLALVWGLRLRRELDLEARIAKLEGPTESDEHHGGTS